MLGCPFKLHDPMKSTKPKTAISRLFRSLNFKALLICLPLMALFTSCYNDKFYDPMGYKWGESIFSVMNEKVLFVLIAILFVVHVILTIIVKAKKYRMPLDKLCKIEVWRMIVMGVMCSLEIVLITNFWLLHNFLSRVNWVNTGLGLFIPVLGIYQLFSIGSVFASLATRESDLKIVKIMNIGILVAVVGAICQFLIISVGAIESYDHEMILDNFFARLGLYVTFGLLAWLIILMIVRTHNLIGSLLAAVCIVPIIFGTLFCAVVGSLVVLLISIFLSFIGQLFLKAFFQPSSVVLGNGEQLTNLEADLITGQITSGTDSYGNVWDYVGGGQWEKK